ncbi:MAG: hypothetical protein AAF907_02710 [Planctomycetota bacterium]
MATGIHGAYRAGVTGSLPPAADSPPDRLSPAELDRRLATHRRAAWLARFVQASATPAALVVLLAGGTLLACRLAGLSPGIALWTGLAGLTAAASWAAFRANRGRVGLRETTASVDRSLRCDGLLMTLLDFPAERRPTAWLSRIEARRDRWRDARPSLPVIEFAKKLIVPSLFAGLAWVVPVGGEPVDRGPVDRTAATDRLTGELAETLAVLTNRPDADPAALAQAGADLRKLQQAIGDGGPTGSQLEAIDALRDRMLSAAAGAAGDIDSAQLAETLGAGADLRAGSGLLESGLVRDAAESLGAPDPRLAADLLNAAGENREALAELAAGLSAELSPEERGALADLGSRLSAGENPGELFANLPPGTVERLTQAAADSGVLSELLASQTPEGGSSPGMTPGPALPSFDLPVALPETLGVTEDELNPAGVAAAALAPGFTGAVGTASDLLGRLTASAAMDGGPRPNADSERDADAPSPAASERAGRPRAPSRRLTSGRPVPPRMRGVVRRYFSGQTPPAPAAD